MMENNRISAQRIHILAEARHKTSKTPPTFFHRETGVFKYLYLAGKNLLLGSDKVELERGPTSYHELFT
jgi:hypothetical protein